MYGYTNEQNQNPRKRNSWSDDSVDDTTHKRRGLQTKDYRPFLVSFLQSDHATIVLTELLKFCKNHEGSWNESLAHGKRVSFFKKYTDMFFDKESETDNMLSYYRRVSDRTLRKKFGEAEDFARTNYFSNSTRGRIPEWGELFCEFFDSQKKSNKQPSITSQPSITPQQEELEVPVGHHPLTAVESLSASVREFCRLFITY